MVRQRAFKMFEFVGAIGGILSLYSAFSVIIGVEIAMVIFIVMKTKIIGTRKQSKIIFVTPKNLIQEDPKLLVNHDHALYDCFQYLISFAEFSSIHGLNYIIDKKKHCENKSVLGNCHFSFGNTLHEFDF